MCCHSVTEPHVDSVTAIRQCIRRTQLKKIPTLNPFFVKLQLANAAVDVNLPWHCCSSMVVARSLMASHHGAVSGRKRLDLWLSLDCSEWRLDPRAHDLSRWTIPHPDHYEGNIKWHATSPLRDATVIESA